MKKQTKPTPSDPQPRPAEEAEIKLPPLAYQPSDPVSYNPPIGLIGCGGITQDHLRAYRSAGYQVVALCDLNRESAEDRRKEFFPDARVYTDFRDLLARDEIEVVDIATHPVGRPKIIESALRAGKHVLSQKPFVLDLDEGQRLVDLAEQCGRQLAVNQNGRWAPHFSFMRAALRDGLLGDLVSACFSVHWDHHWVKGTEFENVRHLILYDFAIHWFDILTCLAVGHEPKRVFASFSRAPGQDVKPALLGQALVEYDTMQASMMFDGTTSCGPQDRTFLSGTRGTIESRGPDCKIQTLTIHTSDGSASPKLHGCWFPDGFHGTMGELLSAIETGRESTISGRDNLKSLALCFAAVASAETHRPIVPGSIRRLSD